MRRPVTGDHALPLQFENGLRSKMGLDHESRLGNEEFKVPFCIVFGEIDYVKSLDKGASEDLIKLKK